MFNDWMELGPHPIDKVSLVLWNKSVSVSMLVVVEVEIPSEESVMVEQNVRCTRGLLRGVST